MVNNKRFSGTPFSVYDLYKEDKFLWTEWDILTDILNNLDTKARENAKALSTVQKKLNNLIDENNILKATNAEMEDYLAEIESKNIEIQEKSNRKQEYIISLEDKIRRMRKAIRQLESNSCTNCSEHFIKSYTDLRHRHSLLHDEHIELECEFDSLKHDVEYLENKNEILKKEKEVATTENVLIKEKALDMLNFYLKIQKPYDMVFLKNAFKEIGLIDDD